MLIINNCYLSSSPFFGMVHVVDISSGQDICKKTTNMRHSAEDMWLACFKMNTFSKNKIKAYFVMK